MCPHAPMSYLNFSGCNLWLLPFLTSPASMRLPLGFHCPRLNKPSICPLLTAPGHPQSRVFHKSFSSISNFTKAYFGNCRASPLLFPKDTFSDFPPPSFAILPIINTSSFFNVWHTTVEYYLFYHECFLRDLLHSFS